MKTKIISAFPSTGKSNFYEDNKKTTLDSDSSKFQWMDNTTNGSRGGEKLIKNFDFPKNYIQHIKDNIGKYEFIFVSSHELVRQAMKDASIHFYLFYPRLEDKQMYLDRYKRRGDVQSFIDLVDTNWETWIQGCQKETGCTNVEMCFPYLSEELHYMLAKENGGDGK